MGYSRNDSHVQGLLFTPSGKWKYEVVLDYTGLDFEDWNLWSNAEKALKQATEKNISGVTISELGDYWILVVPEPWGKNSHPISVNLRNAVEKNPD